MESEEDLKGIEKEANKIRGLHTRFRILIEKCNRELKKFKKVVFEKELDCYMNGNDDCIEEVNSKILKELEVSRKLEINRLEKNQKCWSVIPFAYRPSNEFEWEVKTKEDLEYYRSFFRCSKPYYEQTLIYIQEKKYLSSEVNQKLKKFQRGW